MIIMTKYTDELKYRKKVKRFKPKFRLINIVKIP